MGCEAWLNARRALSRSLTFNHVEQGTRTLERGLDKLAEPRFGYEEERLRCVAHAVAHDLGFLGRHCSTPIAYRR